MASLNQRWVYESKYVLKKLACLKLDPKLRGLNFEKFMNNLKCLVEIRPYLADK